MQTTMNAKKSLLILTSFYDSSFLLPSMSVTRKSSQEKFWANKTGNNPYPITKFVLRRAISVFGCGLILFPAGRWGSPMSLVLKRLEWFYSQWMRYFAFCVEGYQLVLIDAGFAHWTHQRFFRLLQPLKQTRPAEKMSTLGYDWLFGSIKTNSALEHRLFLLFMLTSLVSSFYILTLFLSATWGRLLIQHGRFFVLVCYWCRQLLVTSWFHFNS